MLWHAARVRAALVMRYDVGTKERTVIERRRTWRMHARFATSPSPLSFGMQGMRRNVLLLAACQAMMMTGGSLLVATSALVGVQLAPDESLATVPFAVQVLTGMLTTVPASLLMQRVGRRGGFLVAAAMGAAGAGLAAFAILRASFPLFVAAAALSGTVMGFGAYYRFAAAEVATDEYRSRAISWVLAGGVVAAFAGPNLARVSREWLAAPFAGSFMALAGIMGLSFFTVLFLDIPRPAATHAQPGRPLAAITRQPVFVVAVLGAMVGYGVMSLVMSATPLAMRAHDHPFSDTAFVIQWHVLGMFAPSFFTGNLIRRFGVLNVMMTGALLGGACVAVNLSGTTVWHYAAALALMGIGWNFLFIGGTTLLTESYRPNERAHAQAASEFLILGTAALAVLFSGRMQVQLGWRAVNLSVVPLLATALLAIGWLARTRRTAPAAVNST